MVLRKHELEGKLGEESALIKSGILRDENPLDTSSEFNDFLLACRRGDLKHCQELINQGVNINGKDQYDYTPLIIASLCGHYELVQLLLESGALAERNTFQGERCIYNALNDRIRNLLLQYDFSKSSDPYVYWSSHISTLFHRTTPCTSDISLSVGSRSFELHKFFLSSRTPYFRKKLQAQPETTSWNVASTVPVEAFQIALRYLYLGDLPRDLVPAGSPVSEEEVAKGLDKVSKQLEVEHLWESIIAGGDRRLARQRYQDEVARALQQVEGFFRENVLGHRMVVDADRANEVKWLPDNSIFADVLLRADEPDDHETGLADTQPVTNGAGIPVGPAANADSPPKTTKKAVLYPAHKAMLIRSEYFDRMFSGDFVESHQSEHLRIITVDCTPPVLELILTFLYTENATCPLEHALDLLYAADMLFLDTLKNKAAVAISTLGSGSGSSNAVAARTHENGTSSPEGAANGGDGSGSSSSAPTPVVDVDADVEPINIYDVIHAAWELRVQRLEEFAARYLANRLEDYIDEDEFQDLIRESAERLTERQETDTIELLDDIRYYLSERFRLRFEDAGLEDMMDEDGEINAEAAAAAADAAAAASTTAGDTTAVKAEDDVSAPSEALPGRHPPPDASGGEKIEAADGKEMMDGDDGAVKTLDGATAEDEFASDAINYQILLEKIDAMLDRLKLDA